MSTYKFSRATSRDTAAVRNHLDATRDAINTHTGRRQHQGYIDWEYPFPIARVREQVGLGNCYILRDSVTGRLAASIFLSVTPDTRIWTPEDIEAQPKALYASKFAVNPPGQLFGWRKMPPNICAVAHEVGAEVIRFDALRVNPAFRSDYESFKCTIVGKATFEGINGDVHVDKYEVPVTDHPGQA